MLAGLAETHALAIRWYVPVEHALVLGNGQRPGVADLEVCRERGIPVYKRTSGGTAVLADEQLVSMDVALPAEHSLATSDVVRAYQWIGEVWEEALHALGMAKVHALPTEEVRAIAPLAKDDPLRLACYGTLSPWEVAAGKRKVVGLCQVRRRPGALYQIGVYLHVTPKSLPELLDLGNNQRKTLSTKLHNAIAGLDQVAGRTVTREEVIAAVEAALRSRFGAKLTPSEWTAQELAAAERIERERFQAVG
jgi:lipoate---protein ligase